MSVETWVRCAKCGWDNDHILRYVRAYVDADGDPGSPERIERTCAKCGFSEMVPPADTEIS